MAHLHPFGNKNAIKNERKEKIANMPMVYQNLIFILEFQKHLQRKFPSTTICRKGVKDHRLYGTPEQRHLPERNEIEKEWTGRLYASKSRGIRSLNSQQDMDSVYFSTHITRPIKRSRIGGGKVEMNKK